MIDFNVDDMKAPPAAPVIWVFAYGEHIVRAEAQTWYYARQKASLLLQSKTGKEAPVERLELLAVDDT